MTHQDHVRWLAAALVSSAALAIASAPWALAMPLLNFLGLYWTAQWCIASWLKPR